MFLDATQDVVGAIMRAMMDCYKESRFDNTKTDNDDEEKETSPARNWSVYSWPQTWSNTNLGFGGLAGQAISQAQTVVLRYNTLFVVYHGGQYAYTVKNPNGKFMRAFAEKILPGQVAFNRGGEYEENDGK